MITYRGGFLRQSPLSLSLPRYLGSFSRRLSSSFFDSSTRRDNRTIARLYRRHLSKATPRVSISGRAVHARDELRQTRYFQKDGTGRRMVANAARETRARNDLTRRFFTTLIKCKSFFIAIGIPIRPSFSSVRFTIVRFFLPFFFFILSCSLAAFSPPHPSSSSSPLPARYIPFFSATITRHSLPLRV